MWEVRRTREEQARPLVVVDIQPSAVSGNILNLVIENLGTTMANDVTIHCTPLLESSQPGYNLADMALLREGIAGLPPRRRIEVFFDVSHERHKTDLPMRYDAEVRFKDARGRKQEPLRYVLDLAHLYGPGRVDQFGLHHATKALREIESVLKQSRRGGRLAVWVRDEDAARQADNIEEALTGDYPTLATKPPSDLLMSLGRNVLVRTAIRAARQLASRLQAPSSNGGRP